MIWDVINSDSFFALCFILVIVSLVAYYTYDVILSMSFMSILIIFFGFVGMVPYWVAHLTLLLVTFMFVRMVYAMIIPKEGGSDYRGYSGGDN